MHFKLVQDSAARFLNENAAVVLTAGGVVGTVATAVLAARAAFRASDAIRDETSRRYVETRNETGDIDLEGMSKRDKVVTAAPYFIPPTVVGSATIASIVMSHRISAGKAAALAAAYGVTQKHFDEYRAKVEQKLGIAKEEKIRDDIAQDRVNQTPPPGSLIVIEGEVLCFDECTGRYFKGTVEKINRAVNTINKEIAIHGYAGANQFYDELELPPNTWADGVGWNLDNLCEIKITSVLTPDNQRPCVSFDFRNMPEPNYMQIHS